MTAWTIRDLLAAGDSAIVDLLPVQVEQVTRLDAQYHADVRDEWIELNQIETERNRRIHDQALAEITRDLAPDAAILELGSGVGFDAKRLLESRIRFGCYVISEISPQLLEKSKQHLSVYAAGAAVRYCCLTATDILIADSQLDRLFAIAALHHFPDLPTALSEIDRVTKSGARIIFAIEPNRFWSSVQIALRPLYRRLFPTKAHSAADEEAEGFRIDDFRRMAASHQWELDKIMPAWLLTGFLHHGLEFLYRAMRLKQRIRVPLGVERAFLFCDSILFRLPLLDRLAWHYTVVFRKPTN